MSSSNLNLGGWTMATAVAIDKYRNSQVAVKWAVENLLINHNNLILIHVSHKPPMNAGFVLAESAVDANREHSEAEMEELFLPYREFCARRRVNNKEVIVEDVDVSKAIIDYINDNIILNVVLGSSGRNAIAKRFRQPDVPTILMKNAPDFCTVYVISKGKANVRSAKGPAPFTDASTKQLLSSALCQFPEPEDPIKTPFARGGRKVAMAPPISSATPKRLPKASRDFEIDMDFQGKSGHQSSDFLEHHYHAGDIYESSSSPDHNSKRELEVEMRRMKIELKQTIDMYSAACKEAIRAKHNATELAEMKMKETRKFEAARNSEEAALAMAEAEKTKCKAAMEAAEAAQKIAEIEAEKRWNAEVRFKHEAEERLRALEALQQKGVRYRKYSIEEIELATEYFANSLKVGEGGYGPVYRACLDHTPVAIKVLRPDAAQGRKQFNQEVEVLSCIRHPNMVILLGACPKYGCLVYEYMDNGSLEDRLFRRGNTPPLPWAVRFKIAAEIATALLFLHQNKPEPLVHRDLKPANILLDRNYVSKISDVGLARLVPASVADSVTQFRMTSTAGTFCYIDPEYQQTGMLCCKSDIYSLGVMLLQIITARSPMGLTHHVERAIENGNFEELLDPTVKDWPVEDCLGYARIALKCAELCRKDRPDLATVILPELHRLRNLGLCGTNDISIDSPMTRINSGSRRHPRHRAAGSRSNAEIILNYQS